ncbi:MAG: hypothetical protein ACRD4O_15995 [Bryobacteraceae bacterium]
MPFEIRLQSTDPARPNEELLRQILERQGDLADFLKEEDPSVEDAKVAPQAGFPTGLEPFVISVVVAFATGFAVGVVKGAGGEIGKQVGAELGKRIGVRIRLWIQKEFPDVAVKEVSEK